MPLLPLPSSSDWPSLSSSSDPLFPERLEAMARAFAYHPIVIVPLASGRLAVLTGYGSRRFEFSCLPAELGPILASGLHMAIDNTRPIHYTTLTEIDLGINIEL